MILAAFLIGMTLCGVTLALIRAEDTYDKFGSAGAMFSAWCAFGMLLMAGVYGLGLVLPAIAGGLVLALRSTDTFGQRLHALASYKLPLGVGALLCSVLAWIGVLNLMEEIPYG
ncbi:hypothetical protein [Litoreibacter albidus]|uniref:Uncharacterized protein n=1 Tax=Litoreibacter albidus TaxID=670155 RepID=A0A1H2YZM4_9RHOB|nr:hypothetical protein [Litoreibacter albidus]SDX10104.1 hypothetical protein SAMN04488001_2368 [Litoreibacter albidus]